MSRFADGRRNATASRSHTPCMRAEQHRRWRGQMKVQYAAHYDSHSARAILAAHLFPGRAAAEISARPPAIALATHFRPAHLCPKLPLLLLPCHYRCLCRANHGLALSSSVSEHGVAVYRQSMRSDDGADPSHDECRLGEFASLTFCQGPVTLQSDRTIAPMPSYSANHRVVICNMSPPFRMLSRSAVTEMALHRVIIIFRCRRERSTSATKMSTGVISREPNERWRDGRIRRLDPLASRVSPAGMEPSVARSPPIGTASEM